MPLIYVSLFNLDTITLCRLELLSDDYLCLLAVAAVGVHNIVSADDAHIPNLSPIAFIKVCGCALDNRFLG